MSAKNFFLKLLMLTTVSTFVASTAVAQSDEGLLKKANAQFYEALNAIFAGDLEPMKAVWSHADDVTYMGPRGGFQVGWKQVLADWEKQASLNLGGEVKPGESACAVGTDIAVCHNWERGQNIDQDVDTVSVSIRATNVFRNEDGRWKMISHHTDILPFLTESQEVANRPPPGSNQMLRAGLSMAEGLEVIISDVVIAPETTVPRHYHPGEEFVYALEGSVVHVQEGQPNRIVRPGEAFVIPPQAVHAPRGGPEGGRAIVFRVHVAGRDERILVEE